MRAALVRGWQQMGLGLRRDGRCVVAGGASSWECGPVDRVRAADFLLVDSPLDAEQELASSCKVCMSYRPLNKRQCEARARKLEAMRRGRERAAMANQPRGRMLDLPLVRRTVVVTDHDSGQPAVHMLELRRSRRVDSYAVFADGKPWKVCGWSKVCEGLRKLHQRLPSPRSDFWWHEDAAPAQAAMTS